MSQHTLYDKVWDAHKVAVLPTGEDQIFIGLHLIHEVTSPQAFDMLRAKGVPVAFPQRTFATLDHIVPTRNQKRPFSDSQAEEMTAALEKNVKENGISFFDLSSHKQGIVHVIGPELGLTRPAMTIACGDSHTSTHGAFGALAFGIGTTEVQYVLETQTLPLRRLKVRRIQVEGRLSPGIYAKDVILKIINLLGVKGGIGYAYEYAGTLIQGLSMEERMTICNMSIEGGARIGYVNPDETTLSYLKGREYAPQGVSFEKAAAYWKAMASDESRAHYDAETFLNGGDLEPMVTWGITPGQSIGISEAMPLVSELPDEERLTAQKAYEHMKLKPGAPLCGTPIDVAFIGSCTNSRISDLREAARILKGRKVASNVNVLIVPGSQHVKHQAEKEDLHHIFKDAGAEWRDAGCSMCLAMNPDRLTGDQLCASSSNRNFIGRQGSPTGRTVLMSPAMVAAAAIEGKITDVRKYL